MTALNIATPICNDEMRLARDPRSPATVFVIEGDQPVREVLEAVIELAGLRVESWESAESFLHGFDARRRGCLLVDVELSGMSGIDLALKLTRDRAPISPLLLSGRGDLLSRAQALGLPALAKPFHNASLLRAIYRALRAVGFDDSAAISRGG
jgi:two-component system, LuxR family, response regulator FixJ